MNFGTMQCVAVCCRVLLQCVVAVCVYLEIKIWVAQAFMNFGVLQCVVAVCCSVAVCVHRKNQKLGAQVFMNLGALQCVVAVLQCVAVCCCSVCTSQKSKVGWPRAL